MAKKIIPKVRVHGPAGPWKCFPHGKSIVTAAGRCHGCREIAEAVEQRAFGRLGDLLLKEPEQFGLIVETGDTVFAAVDRVQGYPLFLSQHGQGIEISSDALVWCTPERNPEFDEEQAEIFALAGYCLGSNTLLRTVKRLLPGEYIRVDKFSGDVEQERYYAFNPAFRSTAPAEKLEKTLGEVLDSTIDRMIEAADGRTIWLSLSAGYDSRVILAKLLEHGYPDIETFSYGTPGNMEARVARDLAESVNVRWRFIPPRRDAKRDFWAGAGARYMINAGGLHTTPALTEFYALSDLKEELGDSSGAFFTNGQSGDFITGGHLPKSGQPEDIDRQIWAKHFALLKNVSQSWPEERVAELLDDWKKSHFPGSRASTGSEKAYAFLLFIEWQERQARYVVNQQRAYDYLGLDWSLPLWDGELMDFFQDVPFELQRKQVLYERYLSNWNYRSLFDRLRLPYDPWPRGKAFIRGAAGLARLFKGTGARDAVYRRFYYFSDHHYLYALYGFDAYRAFEKDLRTPATLLAMDYLCRVRRYLELPPKGYPQEDFANLFENQLAALPEIEAPCL